MNTVLNSANNAGTQTVTSAALSHTSIGRCMYGGISKLASMARDCLSVGAASSCKSMAIAMAERRTTDCLSVISKMPDRITSSSACAANRV